MKVVLKFSPIARRYRNRARRRMLRALGPGLASVATWSTVDTELHGETAVVDRTRPVRMLEIGSFYADSLQMWHEYLHPDSLMIGIDISSKLVKIADSGGIHVRIGGEQKASFLREVAAEFGPFDVILDAGSLTTANMVDSFRYLFANALSDSGVYLVKDAYWEHWALYNRVSFADLMSALIDAMYGHFQVATSEANFRVGQLVVVRRATRDLSRNSYRS